MSHSRVAFGPALRSAIADSGMTLHMIQRRLVRRGVSVSVPTLSSWQLGTNRPEKPESLRAVTALEEMFALPLGTLTSLLGPRRPRGRVAAGGSWRRCHGVPYARTIAEPVNEICPAHRSDIKQDLVEEEVVLRPGRRIAAVRTRMWGTARVSGVDRCFSVSYAERGHDIDAIRTNAVKHCRLGRVRRLHEHNIVVSELILDCCYSAGDTFMIEYESMVDQPVVDAEFFRAFSAPVELYVAEIHFDPAELPVRCDRFHSTERNTPRVQQEIRLTSTGTALLTARGSSFRIDGISWEWE